MLGPSSTAPSPGTPLIAILIILGLIALVAGGEILVRGASTLAAAARVPPLVIGLTVVAFGTSAPELAVSLQACFAEGNKSDLAVGNVVGSNISNVLLILGFSAIFFPLSVHLRLFKLDLPVMIAAALGLWVLGLDGELTRVDGLLFVVAMLGYFWWTVTQGRRESRRLAAEFEDMLPEGDPTAIKSVINSIAQFVGGLLLLVLGADWLVDGCSRLAAMFGVSELVIGLTVVAVGTSLPELVTSIVAALRGHRDLAVGNVVGSNILNVLAVLGITAAAAPHGVQVNPRAVSFDIPVMIAVSLACLPVFLSGLSITRSEGAVLFALFIAYTAFLVWSSVNAVTPTATMAAWFAGPLLASAVLVSLLGVGRSSTDG